MRHFMGTVTGSFLAAVTLASAVQADVVSVNFNGREPNGPEFPVGSNATLTGVVPRAASTFFNGSGASGSGTLNSDVASGVGSIGWLANFAYRSDTTGTVGSENYNLMKGYLDMTGANDGVIISGLSSAFSGGFDLYIYTDGDDFAGTTVNKTYRVTDADGVLHTVATSTNGGYTYGNAPSTGFDETTGAGDTGNYVILHGLTGDNFSIQPQVGGNGSPLNGFQIVATSTSPEPTAFGLLSAGGLLALRRRRAC